MMKTGTRIGCVEPAQSLEPRNVGVVFPTDPISSKQITNNNESISCLKLNNTKLNLIENKKRRIRNNTHNQDQVTYHRDLMIKFSEFFREFKTIFIIRILG